MSCVVAACGWFVAWDGYFPRENTTILIIFVVTMDTPPCERHSATSHTFSHSQKNWEFERNCEMLGKLGTLFSSITASSSGSKDFPYTSSPPIQLTSLWSYCKASKKVGSTEDSHVSACLMVTALWYWVIWVALSSQTDGTSVAVLSCELANRPESEVGECGMPRGMLSLTTIRACMYSHTCNVAHTISVSLHMCRWRQPMLHM